MLLTRSTQLTFGDVLGKPRGGARALGSGVFADLPKSTPPPRAGLRFATGRPGMMSTRCGTTSRVVNREDVFEDPLASSNWASVL